MFQFLKRQSVAILAILVVCSLVGCKAIYSDNADVENAFRKDATFDWADTARPEDDDIKYFGYSDKARAIEKHMGGN